MCVLAVGDQVELRDGAWLAWKPSGAGSVGEITAVDSKNVYGTTGQVTVRWSGPDDNCYVYSPRDLQKVGSPKAYYSYTVETVNEAGRFGTSKQATSCVDDRCLSTAIQEAVTDGLYFLGECEYPRVNISVYRTCSQCHGDGEVARARGRGKKKCPECKGKDSLQTVAAFELLPNSPSGHSDVVVTTASKFAAA